MCTVNSGSVKLRQKAIKLFDVHVFFISMTFRSIYGLRFGDF